MDLSIHQWLAAALILFASSVLQGVVGFASGLFGIPLLLLSGFTLPQSITIILLAAAAQTITGSVRLRREIDLRRAWRPALIRVATLPLGIATLWWASSLDPDLIKQLIGGMLLAIVGFQVLFRVPPMEELPAGWEWLAFSLSGFLLGFCGMGGPPMALWVMAHDWSATRSRAFLFFVLMTGMIPQFCLLLWLYGSEVFQAALLGLIGIPVVLLGTAFGLRLGAGLPKRGLRRIVYVVLTLIAISAIASPFLRREEAADPTTPRGREARSSRPEAAAMPPHRYGDDTVFWPAGCSRLRSMNSMVLASNSLPRSPA